MIRIAVTNKIVCRIGEEVPQAESFAALFTLASEIQAALFGIHEMADEDLRLGNHPLDTSLFQIEANARAALRLPSSNLDGNSDLEGEEKF